MSVSNQVHLLAVNRAPNVHEYCIEENVYHPSCDLNFDLWASLTFKLDKPASLMSMSEVISFESYCQDRHTRPSALSEPRQ